MKPALIIRFGAVLTILLGLLLSACGETATPTPLAPLVTSGPATHRFERVLFVVLENTNDEQALRQPYLAKFAANGAQLTNFHAVAHPSFPNYLALVAGSTFGITEDRPVDLNETSLAELMDRAGVSWKAYAEQLPDQPCFMGETAGAYARKHEPFISFTSIQRDPVRCAKIVPGTHFQADVASAQLPRYMLYIPDLNNDGHDTGAAFTSKWLQGFLTPLLENPKFNVGTLVVVTFDEADDDPTNRIYTALLGDMVLPGATSATRYTHYNLLRMVEENFGLGTLGREDARSSDISGIWKNK